jgi:hypothetical protein
VNSAIWTTVLYKSGSVESAYEYASREPELAREEIKKRYPGHDILALVLGRHVATYTFDQSTPVPCQPYANDSNQPTGGSD